MPYNFQKSFYLGTEETAKSLRIEKDGKILMPHIPLLESTLGSAVLVAKALNLVNSLISSQALFWSRSGSRTECWKGCENRTSRQDSASETKKSFSELNSFQKRLFSGSIVGTDFVFRFQNIPFLFWNRNCLIIGCLGGWAVTRLRGLHCTRKWRERERERVRKGREEAFKATTKVARNVLKKLSFCKTTQKLIFSKRPKLRLFSISSSFRKPCASKVPAS